MQKAAIFFLIFLSACQKTPTPLKTVDVLMVGAGIMSSTLASLLINLDENINIDIYERMNEAALESSEAWNNAGTGHAGYCELNYTPELPDGEIDIKKAIEINEAFEISKQFWAFEVEKGIILSPKSFLRQVPHISLVLGEQNVSYLKRRYEALIKNPLFLGMQYTESHQKIKEWAPLTIEGRNEKDMLAATRYKEGTDVNFGALAKMQIEYLEKNPHVKINFSHEVIDLKRNADDTWLVVIKDLNKKSMISINAKKVFIGAGGASLSILQKAKIPESKGLAGFPVGGMWLVSDKPMVTKNHEAKVYGKASLGAPPMSVPHLDSRYIDGKEYVLFGPFATFSTKFLKTGSYLDWILSINLNNFIPLMQVAFKNFDLTKYLIKQVLLSPKERMDILREYYPNAKDEDWQLEIAGQRVQVIKDDPQKGGILQFGTEIISAKDGTIVALLGASPGASVAVKAMLEVLNRSFKENMKSPLWQEKLKNMIPSYGQSLNENKKLLEEVRTKDNRILNLSD